MEVLKVHLLTSLSLSLMFSPGTKENPFIVLVRLLQLFITSLMFLFNPVVSVCASHIHVREITNCVQPWVLCSFLSSSSYAALTGVFFKSLVFVTSSQWSLNSALQCTLQLVHLVGIVIVVFALTHVLPEVVDFHGNVLGLVDLFNASFEVFLYCHFNIHRCLHSSCFRN